ncbi:Fe-S cluster assembly protein SufD [Thermobispora bispora]|uniref:FeS assembly protein SufD n=1 Tax=Thermobispora bispora (strain ATCC 19993 / DSM 43833 / CBS 139.67 / JCM 10125 / KCTC 9307 / NBRC 14880 / R51) TaxID=469371 RepID=D6Y1S7_THEBD|nr:Fe-S cluster assembly protein SufD [Thermobispora bispora]MBO2474581.1 Fe-S cluster assembly protein SufD [Actinomycetales bacterium]MDI9580382.1 Fe-S cluster assembly protein SufD [Thermobispora sp.]ADG88683.1 FeS assembly protein SufD [Thermobispora bispora DSM 43833]MBX6166898.1 Fe-S cluster assembly protein SufD [Thermobispora bispora]QSI48464.1 Fe-S cluster assembly protein SufD [Thermobispora bispora]
MGVETKPLSTLHEFSSYDVADFPVPTGREEAWRFTPLTRLKGLHDGSAALTGGVTVEVDAAPEVRVETVKRDDPRIGRAYTPTDRVSAQAYASFETATVLTVPREAAASRPTTINVRGTGGVGFGHTVVVLEPMAEATVILDHRGGGVYADNVEFDIGEGATLRVVSLQDWDDTAVHVAHHHARLGKDATFRSFVVTVGGDLVRLSPSVGFTAPGGDAELLGLYYVDAGQHLEHRLLVDHSVPDCRSRVTYKGALQGEGAHAVWVGDVIIRTEATGTDTYELNRNLILTDGARADSVPNLEILTGEVVGAGHASASGRLDEEHLFYLQSRGIPYQEARRLVVHGFFAELIENIEVPEVRERVLATVEAELER